MFGHSNYVCPEKIAKMGDRQPSMRVRFGSDLVSSDDLGGPAMIRISCLGSDFDA